MRYYIKLHSGYACFIGGVFYRDSEPVYSYSYAEGLNDITARLRAMGTQYELVPKG
jgi:hypothetical protein